MKIIITSIIALFGMFTMHSQEIIPLYKTVPNSKPAPNKEINSTKGYVHTVNVSIPTITVYKPLKPGAQRSAVIICPGGGYGALAMGHEGADVAALNEQQHRIATRRLGSGDDPGDVRPGCDRGAVD